MKKCNEWKRPKIRMAARMRRNPTAAERHLRVALRERLFRCGWPKFRFQRRALGYILDFFDPKSGVCVEVDGGGHTAPQQQAWDENRTAALARYGVRVLRFSNERVLTDTKSVLAEIEAAWRIGREVALPKCRYYTMWRGTPRA